LKDRRQNQSQDFSRVNKTKLKLMSHGRLPQPRIDLPDNVETFQYSSQQLNIWEFQKDQLRKTISNDRSKHYTYSKDHLSLAFPIVNEAEVALEEKSRNQARWKTA
jgi:hypothetical protein